MRVQNVDTKSFLENLEVVGNAVATKSPMPCLTSVYIKANDDRIILLGSDSNTAIKRVIFAKETDNTIFDIVENGIALVDYKLFKAILSKLENATSDFYIESNQFTIRSEKSVYKLNMINPEEYPKVEFKKLENEIEIRTEDLKNIISKVSFSCATDVKKPILTGVNFKCENNILNCVATDSFRLSKYSLDFNNEINDTNFTFPKQSLIALDKIISKTKQEYIKLLYDNSNEVVVNVDNTLYKTRLLDGNYPDANKIFSQKYSNVCVVNKDLLIKSIDRISLFTINDDFNYSVIKLSFRDNKTIEINCTNNQLGNAKEVVECDNCDFNLEIACSSIYLLSSLTSFASEKIKININSNLTPFSLTSDDETNLIQICLPMKVE